MNVILSGLGGQGIILATLILANAAMKDGFDVVVSELHGMSQRGGSVFSHVRFGDKIYAPTVAEGSADLILSFEPSETLRSLRFANSETVIILNTRIVVPPAVSLGTSRYPSFESIIQECRKLTNRIFDVDANGLASEAGNTLASNIVILGFSLAIGAIPLRRETLRECIRELASGKYVEANLKAFDLGFNAASSEAVNRKV